MEVFKTKKEARNYLCSLLQKGKTIGFVPTMGALHDGHIQLVRKAHAENDLTIASIFVNPTQFNNAVDLEKYPRMPLLDLALLEESGCHAVFMPEIHEMYNEGEPVLNLELNGLDKVMEGEFRPGHFKGVITIVDKLFTVIQPYQAYFGEKDFQQLTIIRFMAAQLYPEIKIIGCPTVREKNGLALSSRNLRLTPEERISAAIIYKSLENAVHWKANHTVSEVKEKVKNQVNQVFPFKVEYFEIVDAESLAPINNWQNARPLRACIAVLAANVRLIDNIAL